ncbi:MAG TPA: hypothetical protein VLG11_00635 [Candidatus Saccharimonadales bacterium]|nr:hypothetical protein [Candidatus Saccharimonadales bacterium]
MRGIRLGPKFLVLVIAALFGCWIVPGVAAAQSAPTFNLTTSPVYATLATKPGQAVSTQIKVQNNASTAVTLTVQLMKFKAYGTSGQAQLLTSDGNDPSMKWVSFSATTLVARPGVWNTVQMNIKPDRTAAFGYYYAVVFTQATTHGNVPAPNLNTVNGSSAVLVLLDVQVPGEKRQMTVTDFKPQHSISEFLPVTFNITAKNTGNIYAAPTGDVYISRNHKDTLAVLPVNQAESNILPGTSRALTAAWDDGFPAHIVRRIGGQMVTDSNGQPKTQLSWDGSKLNKFRFGHYYAHLLLVYNNGTQDVPLEAETSFWVIPWKLLLLAAVLIGLIIFGLVTLLRHTARLGKTVMARGKKGAKPKPEA